MYCCLNHPSSFISSLCAVFSFVSSLCAVSCFVSSFLAPTVSFLPRSSPTRNLILPTGEDLRSEGIHKDHRIPTLQEVPGAAEKTREMSEGVLFRLLDRTVKIEITNKTHDITLHNPRSYCYSGYSTTPPSPKIPPGVTESCQFTNSIIRFRGCVGLLVYKADTFTLAILFSNPFDRNIFDMELAMEISFRKAHLGNLENIYRRMYSGNPDDTGKATSFHRVKLGACQETVFVSDGGVMITATMSNAKQSIIKIVMENQDGPTP